VRIAADEDVPFDPNHWSSTREGRQRHFEQLLGLRVGDLDPKVVAQRRKDEMVAMSAAVDRYWKGEK